jgi:tripartite-type tricarboxylate transporter receptor subunit TctC
MSALIRCAALAAFFLSSAAFAQYPAKPIRMIVPFPAGAIADQIARILGQQLQSSLGQPIVVDNRAGADGTIAVDATIKSPPDGYTILLGTSSPTSQIHLLRKNPPYDAINGLTPLSFLGRFSFFLIAHQNLPAKSVAELVAYARANPGKLNSGSGNNGAILLNAQFFKQAGINVVNVHYKGEAPAVNDLVTGRTNFMFIATTQPAFNFVREGKLRVLATVLQSRSVLQPDVPTMAEAGYPGVQNAGWAAMFGPAKLAPGVTQRLSGAVQEGLKRQDVRDSLAQLAFEASGSTPEALLALMKQDAVRMKEVFADAGIEPQ